MEIDKLDSSILRENIERDVHKILNTGSRNFQYRRTTPMEKRLVDYIIEKLAKQQIKEDKSE